MNADFTQANSLPLIHCNNLLFVLQTWAMRVWHPSHCGQKAWTEGVTPRGKSAFLGTAPKDSPSPSAGWVLCKSHNQQCFHVKSGVTGLMPRLQTVKFQGISNHIFTKVSDFKTSNPNYHLASPVRAQLVKHSSCVRAYGRPHNWSSVDRKMCIVSCTDTLIDTNL